MNRITDTTTLPQYNIENMSDQEVGRTTFIYNHDLAQQSLIRKHKNVNFCGYPINQKFTNVKIQSLNIFCFHEY